MKVCTDACLFGAYVASTLPDHPATNHVLDIGTGTGLLSLMLAQKTSCNIDAVEIDAAAFQQAKENIALSPWKHRIEIFNENILQFAPKNKYGLIITNPPFFEGDLKSADQKKNAAKHNTSLTLTQLLKIADELLAENGVFTVLLPFHRVDHFEEEAKDLHFFLSKLSELHSKFGHLKKTKKTPRGRFYLFKHT